MPSIIVPARNNPESTAKCLGSLLLSSAETTARDERDCLAARLETWDFQAPEFYKKQGYDVVCAIPDYPPGITEYTLTKRFTVIPGPHRPDPAEQNTPGPPRETPHENGTGQ